MNYKTLKDLPDIGGVPVLVRLDLNVPVQNGRVMDDYRLKKSLPTISFLRQKGAKIVILSHIEGGTDSLKPIFDQLKKSTPISFCQDVLKSGQEAVASLKDSEVLLCENLRMYEGEKNNDQEFAKKLAALGKFFVNDAFPVSHRAHASIVSLPKFLPSFAGLQFEEEVKNLSMCFNPPHPFLFILGGAKFETKLPLVQKFLPLADKIIIGGAVATDIMRAQGMEMGVSLVSKTKLDLSSYLKNEKIILPVDLVVESQNGMGELREVAGIGKNEKIVDIGPRSVEIFKNLISEAKMILWNGPFGRYEDGFKKPTLEIAEAVASSGAKSVVGGGDTLAAISELGLENKFTFVSTAGGAMLDFLAHGTLVGLEALKIK